MRRLDRAAGIIKVSSEHWSHKPVIVNSGCHWEEGCYLSVHHAVFATNLVEPSKIRIKLKCASLTLDVQLFKKSGNLP